MSFVNTQYFTISLIVIVAIAILLNRLNAGYFKWVKAYWFYDRTWMSRISAFFYLLSLFLLMLSLLDLRGPEKKVRASLPDQRTIILLDTSASMLAEDVRPSRFVKSLQLARHFVKNAAGHQVSIVLFSDIQKRLIPFTDDIDLLDSRLAALEKTNSVAGGSNISQAIEEALQYFEFDSGDDDKTKSGNMLVFTDAEESEGEFKINVPAHVNLAVVGIGTLKGANIPLRWEDGSFRGYKNFKGQPVVTKLDEDYIRKIGKNAGSFKYWVANSYSLPTDDIMNFFRATYNKKQSTGDMRIRPVYSHYILIPAIILYCLSVIFGRFPVFKMSKMLVVFFFLGTSLQQAKAQTKPVSPELRRDLEIIKEGKADRKYVLKVAEKLLKEKEDAKASELYSEYAKKNDDEEIKFNHATALMKSNKLAEALPMVQDLLKNSQNEELKNKLRNNLLLSTDPDRQKEKEKENEKQNQDKDQQDQQNQQDKQDNKENKENKENKNQQNQQQKDNKKDGGKNEKEDQNKNNKPDGKQDNSQKKPDNNGKQDDKEKDKNEKNKGKDKKNDQESEKEPEQKGPQSLEEKEKEIERKRRMTKTPGVIKQLMSDDRELQKKMMDTSTSERGEMKPKRDW